MHPIKNAITISLLNLMKLVFPLIKISEIRPNIIGPSSKIIDPNVDIIFGFAPLLIPLMKIVSLHAL